MKVPKDDISSYPDENDMSRNSANLSSHSGNHGYLGKEKGHSSERLEINREEFKLRKSEFGNQDSFKNPFETSEDKNRSNDGFTPNPELRIGAQGKKNS